MIGDTIPDQAVSQREVAAAIDQWFGNPRGELLLGITPYLSYAIVAEDDDARFIGSCWDALMNPQLEPVFAYAQANGLLNSRSARDLFLSFAANPDEELAEILAAIAG